MAVVAVLEIHIDRNIVGTIKPSINLEICNHETFLKVEFRKGIVINGTTL
jgi:hypothetical protein